MRDGQSTGEDGLAALLEPGPGPIERLLGQPRAVETLSRALRAGRVHHAWIFHGPPGVGKFTAAISFAALALRAGPDGSDGADVGRSGSAADGLRRSSGARVAVVPPDVHVITRELAAYSRDEQVRGRKLLSIPKAVIEEFLIEPASRTRVVAGPSPIGKVFIVDEAELLEGPSQNALLKTLEEPAPGTVIILVTSREHRLMATVRSRCQRVAFGALDAPAMEQWLNACWPALVAQADAAGGANGRLTARHRQLIAELADGSPGRAVLAVRTGLWRWRERLDPLLAQLESGRYPVELSATMAELTDQWAAQWVAAQGGSSKEAANRAAAGHLFHLLGQRYRARLHAPRALAAERAAAAEAIERIVDAEGLLSANVNATMVYEQLCAGLAQCVARQWTGGGQPARA